MKKLLLAATAIAAATVGSVSAAELKIAIFDAQEVLNNTNASKRAVATLGAKREAAQTKINALEKPLIDKQNKLREQQAVLSPEKFQAAQAEFGKDLAKFRADAQAVQTDLDSEGMKLRKQVGDAVKTAVTEIAKEKSYDLVIPKSMAFSASAQVPDITADALARANKLLDK